MSKAYARGNVSMETNFLPFTHGYKIWLIVIIVVNQHEWILYGFQVLLSLWKMLKYSYFGTRSVLSVLSELGYDCHNNIAPYQRYTYNTNILNILIHILIQFNTK
jgi:hypothetical protein